MPDVVTGSSAARPGERTRPSRGEAIVRGGVALAVALLCGGATAGPQPQSPPTSFGGRYQDLADDQRALFDDVLRRYNAIAATSHAPETAYDALALSMRTTFEAVTQALAAVALTDSAGRPLGTALELVASVDEILGQVRGARGDRQFRLYVHLAEDALDRLARSREFVRGSDNTIYHRGYPVNFRLAGGTPSIQISASRDGRRADIDVDYRSASFPAALFNGHLTSANSDVRSGDNYERHVGRWHGLSNWWNRLLAFFRSPPRRETERAPASGIPWEPRVAGGPLARAVEDFLFSWLVERRPDLAAAYFSPVSFACVGGGTGAPGERGLERYVLAEGMKRANEALGEPRDLSAAALSVNPWDPRLRVMRHRLGARFLLAEVPEEVASAYDCASRFDASGVPNLDFDAYYASAFRLRIPGGPTPVLVLLWAREGKGWRIVAYDFEEAAEPTLPLRTARPEADEAAPKARRTTGDPGLVEAATRFHRAWFLDRDLDGALAFFTPGSYECLRAVSQGTMAAERGSMLTMLEQTTARVAARDALASAIRTVEPREADVAIVAHPQQDAFALLPVRDAFGDAATCGAELPGRDAIQASGSSGTTGRFYVSYFQLNLPGDPAFLWMLWEKRGGDWGIRYWTVVTA